MNVFSIPKGQQLIFSGYAPRYTMNEECEYRPDVLVNKVNMNDDIHKDIQICNLNNTSPLTLKIGDVIRYPSQKFIEAFVNG